MAKNIVLLSDGTGNSARSTTPTNVGRLYAALSLQDPTKQVAFYDDGVGTARFKLLKTIGGAFGFGLKANVLEMYKFLCRSYAEDDRIYIFGFSRGAYTVRVLVGLVHAYGLISNTNNETEAALTRKARQNYASFRKGFRRAPARILWWLKQKRQTGKHAPNSEQSPSKGPPIRILGVWDTVDAYGLPIDELAVAWDYFIYPYRFRDRTLSDSVAKAYHAIALDDERHTFHPVLWDERSERDRARIEQVWFAGVHANVGGGYPDDTLAHVSLDWMLSRLERANGTNELYLISPVAERLTARKDPHGKLYDSRSGLQAYYRYKPRDVAALCDDTVTGVEAQIRIHQSVVDRIAGGFVAYHPIGIPAEYAVVQTDRNNKPPLFETDDQKDRRMQKLRAVWDTVFWRRGLHILLLVTTAVLVATPFLPGAGPEACDSGSIVCSTATSILNFVEPKLPGFAGRWIDVLRHDPGWFWGFVAMFAAIFVASVALKRELRRLAAAAWAQRLKAAGHGQPAVPQETFTYKLRTLCKERCQIVSGGLASIIGLAILLAAPALLFLFI